MNRNSKKHSTYIDSTFRINVIYFYTFLIYFIFFIHTLMRKTCTILEFNMLSTCFLTLAFIGVPISPIYIHVYNYSFHTLFHFIHKLFLSFFGLLFFYIDSIFCFLTKNVLACSLGCLNLISFDLFFR